MEWGGAKMVSLTSGIFSQISLNVEESKGNSRSACFPKVTIKGNQYLSQGITVSWAVRASVVQ